MAGDEPLVDDLVGPMLRFLEIHLRILKGDLHKHVILLAIAERSVAHPAHRAQSEAERTSDETPPFPTRGVNVRSIAETSGIPRETVRRKVVQLVEAGWVVAGEETLQLTPKAYRDLEPARLALESLARRFHAVIQERGEDA
ncbi:hypothetical protein ACO2Q0_07310 [Phenylobacterium sp. VNQ135]|uniref:hypothetical protein n=1 Tax=Phenylobacterium sp. VNQ135 TaxID=3400922 RepID=UPI003BFF1E49